MSEYFGFAELRIIEPLKLKNEVQWNVSCLNEISRNDDEKI